MTHEINTKGNILIKKTMYNVAIITDVKRNNNKNNIKLLDM